jgi:L-asparaginase
MWAFGNSSFMANCWGMKIIQDHIHCIITGGTIDSVFDAAKDMVVVNEASSIKGYIDSMVQPHFSWSQEVLTMRDSREMTDEIRLEILRSIKKSPHTKFLVTHGTYTMPDTARYLENGLGSGHDKTITLTGSMLPLCAI